MRLEPAAADWNALTAIGTFVLALIAAAAIIVTVWLAVTDRRRDDNRRREDRQHEAMLRREDDEKWQRRFAAEQRDREDYEARQVTVEVAPSSTLTPPQRESMRPSAIREPTHLITVSTPATYPVKQVDVMIAHRSGGSLGTTALALVKWMSV